MVAAYVGGKSNYWPHMIFTVLITAETIYLKLNGTLKDPIWFDIMAGFSLIIGIWVGYLLRTHFVKK